MLYVVGGVAVLIGLASITVVSEVGGVLLGGLAILAGGASVLFGLRVQLSRTDAEARLRQQARTEQRVAGELETLATSGWVLLHDRLLAGTHHRVAHIVVGPAGVCIVTPMPPGALSIVGHTVDDEDYRQLYAGSMHLDTWLHSRTWEVGQLEPAIASALPDIVWSGPTIPLVVRVSPVTWREWIWPPRWRAASVPDMPFAWHGVELRPVTAVVDMLHGLPSPLARTEVATVAAAVEQLCPPAGRDDGHSVPNNSP